MMKKLKLYLDTSVISYLDQNDSTDKMGETLAFWEDVKQDKYEIYLSKITLDEMDRCDPPKLAILRKYLSQIRFTVLELDEEVEFLAFKFIELGILTRKSQDDCYHIAFAMKHACDAILSWNFKHIYNIKTIKGVKTVSGITGYPEIAIYIPSLFLEREN